MKTPNLTLVLLLIVLFFPEDSSAQAKQQKTLEVGVGRVDITPERSIRLTGYSERDMAFDSVYHQLWGKALAFGTADHGYSILITVDLLGIPGSITQKVREELMQQVNVRPENIAISASHTHSGPQIGSIISHFHKPLSPDELADVALYSQELVPKLVKVALDAIKDIRPSFVSWGQGKVGFAVNRRLNFNPDGPVDHAMPLLKVTDMHSQTRAILVSYACHAVTLGPKNNAVHGDWVGEAQLQIEAQHPGAVALVAIGCGGDQNSHPRMNVERPETDFENARIQGKSIADEVTRLVSSPSLQPIQQLPRGNLNYVDLEFAEMPDPLKLAQDAKGAGRTSNYSNLILGRLARSEMSDRISYPVQVWTFGSSLAMIFLAGEVVVDYSLRLKREFGSHRVWVNAYSNDMPCYIPSLRVLKEGGYEAETAMIGYEKPSKFTEDVEERIMNTIYETMPDAYLKK